MFKLALHWQILIGMLAGAAIGVTLNATGGRSRTVISDGLSSDVSAVEIDDTHDAIEIKEQLRDGTSRVFIIGPTGTHQESSQAIRLPNIDALSHQEPKLYNLFQSRGQSVARVWGERFRRIGGLFLRLLKMVESLMLIMPTIEVLFI